MWPGSAGRAGHVPAASTIFTNPSYYSLSNTRYCAVFLPQVDLAIIASIAGASLASRPQAPVPARLDQSPLRHALCAARCFSALCSIHGGPKKMIASTYIIPAVLLAWSATLFHAGSLTATTQTLM